MKVLIQGSGIAGPALAHWLTKLKHRVTIIERAPELRAAGQQIDIREQGVDVVERMGLLQKFREHIVDEAGLQFIGLDGKKKALFPRRENNNGQGFTSEFEIMRGDLCRILYDDTKETTEYRFGTSVEDFSDEGDGVRVRFTDGMEEKYDLLVAADGQESRIRRRILDEETERLARRSVGVAGCYYSIERDEPGEQLASVYHATDRRVISTRWHTKHQGQAYFFTMSHIDRIRAVLKRDVEIQKKLFADLWKDAGWQAPQLVAAMLQSPDFYAQEIVQIRSPTWSKGRVVLLGDAGYAPSPLTGMGTSVAFMGAYVLAGEIARHPDDILQALKSYQQTFKPFVDKLQDLPRGIPDLVYPKSEWGIRVLYGLVGFGSAVNLGRVLEMMPSRRRTWQLPPAPC